MRIARIAVPFIAAVGLAIAVVAPASAEPAGTQSLSQCQYNSFCAWNGANYNGSFTSGNQCPTGGYTKSLGAIGGGVSAKNNRSFGTVYFYANGSLVATLGPGASSASLPKIVTSMTCFG